MDTNHSILIVDDDPMLRKTLTDILNAKGFFPIAIDKGETALEKVKLNMLPVALIDLKLEDIPGLELMDQIKKYSPNTECVILTGHASQASAIEAVNLGAYGYMKKPYDVEQLLMMIRRAIEKKESIEALRKSEERYRSLFDGIPVGNYRTTPVGEVLDANMAMVEILGYPDRDSLLAVKATDYYKDPKDRKHWQTTMDREGVVHGFELQHKKYDGSVIWVEDDARAVRDENGIVLYYEGSLRDITQRKHVERELVESEERFRSAMEYAPIGKALVAPDGRWLKVNRSLCNMLGYSEDELLKTNFQSLTFPEDLDSDLEYVRQMLAGEIETYQMEKRYIHKQGHIVWALFSVSLVHNSVGEPLYFISQIQDITSRKQAEEALRLSEQKSRAQYKGIPVPTYTWKRVNEDFELVDYNDAAVTITRGGIADIVGTKASKLYPDRPDILEDLSHCFNEKTSIEREMLYQFKTTDENKYLAVKYAFVPSDLILVHTEDITNRKTAEEQIRKKSAILEAINKVFQETFACESEEDVAYMCINVAEKLTGSEFGLIGEINEKSRFDTITLGDLGWAICKMAESDAITLTKNMIIRGIWGQCIYYIKKGPYFI